MITVLLFDMFIMPVGSFALDNENVAVSEDQKAAATETEAVQEEETSDMVKVRYTFCTLKRCCY